MKEPLFMQVMILCLVRVFVHVGSFLLRERIGCACYSCLRTCNRCDFDWRRILMTVAPVYSYVCTVSSGSECLICLSCRSMSLYM